jgi:hypothetical protein
LEHKEASGTKAHHEGEASPGESEPERDLTREKSRRREEARTGPEGAAESSHA